MNYTDQTMTSAPCGTADDSTGLKPVSGTKEWAASNINIQNGCPNDCAYCYAKQIALRFHRATPSSWAHPVPREGRPRRYHRRTGRIMFPSSHDITPSNLTECVAVLLALLQAGNDVLIVSKPDPVCIKRLCAELQSYNAQILFRFTIGSADDRVLRRWEPGAPSFAQRLEALRQAFEQGFQTSVSCEPMLDDNIAAVVEQVRPYVTDSIWLGKMNNALHIVRMNSPNDTELHALARELVKSQNDDAIHRLYEQFSLDPLIRWKDSIKQVVGVERPTKAGMDI